MEKTNIEINHLHFQKLMFLYNALENGWTIKKKNDSYTFIKNHENKKEVFLESYLLNFIKKNLDVNTLLI